MVVVKAGSGSFFCGFASRFLPLLSRRNIRAHTPNTMTKPSTENSPELQFDQQVCTRKESRQAVRRRKACSKIHFCKIFGDWRRRCVPESGGEPFRRRAGSPLSKIVGHTAARLCCVAPEPLFLRPLLTKKFSLPLALFLRRHYGSEEKQGGVISPLFLSGYALSDSSDKISLILSGSKRRFRKCTPSQRQFRRSLKARTLSNAQVM